MYDSKSQLDFVGSVLGILTIDLERTLLVVVSWVIGDFVIKCLRIELQRLQFAIFSWLFGRFGMLVLFRESFVFRNELWKFSPPLEDFYYGDFGSVKINGFHRTVCEIEILLLGCFVSFGYIFSSLSLWFMRRTIRFLIFVGYCAKLPTDAISSGFCKRNDHVCPPSLSCLCVSLSLLLFKFNGYKVRVFN